MDNFSLLTPTSFAGSFSILSDVTLHDLGLDSIVKSVAKKESEQGLLLRVLSKMTDDPSVTVYRSDVFSDIISHPKMCDELMTILDKIDFLRDYGSLRHEYEESAAVWDLVHRLEEIKDYIDCVEAFYNCLSKEDLKSEGLIALRNYVNQLYTDKGFDALKKDILALKADTQNLKSVTVGINLNDRFEADSIGVVSVNNKYFTKANIIGSFADKIAGKDKINDTSEWNGKLSYSPFTADNDTIAASMESLAKVRITMTNPLLGLGLSGVAKGDTTEDITRYMERVTNHMLAGTVKRLRETLNKYVSITITNITDLIPEFVYYIRMADFVRELSKKGYSFCKPSILKDSKDLSMDAKGIYNLKLAVSDSCKPSDIVCNDLTFSVKQNLYLLTGANRGGKTTITQAVGLIFTLAQGGIDIPGSSFSFLPADKILTHFPADEDKTLDLGRLGEECKRFRELYTEASGSSLLLLNETFSTTSFEEGYYIAKDSVKALLQKGIRTIYNTHMHKLAGDIDDINSIEAEKKAASLIVKSDNGNRSFKVEVAPPEGMSYASDIAKKYGVTYEMLIEESSH